MGLDPCFIYPGHIGKAGYGLDYDPRTQKTILAHRFAYELTHGPIPEGMVIAHICNQKACVNPAHLKAITQSENVKQAYEDGLAKGPKKLTEIQVKEIIALLNTHNTTQRSIAIMYGVDQKTIWNIAHGKFYGEFTGHGGSCGI